LLQFKAPKAKKPLRTPVRALLCCVAFTAALGSGFAQPANGEQLPIRNYTIADGLARDYVSCIVQDSHGFLWFCTPEGLSRFDGYKFVNYGLTQGLPHRSVRDLLESSDGTYWLATGDGLCHFDPAASIRSSGNQSTPSPDRISGSAARFRIYRPNQRKEARSFNTILEDHAGIIWCGTDAGLYRLESSQGQWTFSFVEIGAPADPASSTVSAIVEDERGSLWVGTSSGLYRRFSDGRVERFTTQNGLPFDDVRSVIEDRQGKMWVGTTLGLCRLGSEPDARGRAVEHVYSERDGLSDKLVTSLFQTGEGKFWVGTSGGLSELIQSDAAGGQQFRSYMTPEGLSDRHITALAEDHAGNLWVGTESGGAMKLARNGFATYLEADGLSSLRVASIFENQAGELFVISGRGFIHRFDGHSFTAIRANLPEPVKDASWGWNQIAFQDRNGEWWIPTIRGLCRFSKVSNVDQLAQAAPKRIYTRRDGLTGDQIFRLYEDTHGDIWISTLDNVESTLTRWERATETFHRYTVADGMPSTAPTIFREDHAGNLWMGFYGGGLVRYKSQHFTTFTAADGVPAGMIRDLYVDQNGRLWVAASLEGLGRLDDPGVDHPTFRRYATANGLASDQVNCVTADQSGRMYIGTARGLDRLDLATGSLRHYTAADGLGNNFINVSFRDHHGVLWFGTLQGLSRVVPDAVRASSPPPILIAGMRIGGVARALSDLGEGAVSGILVPPDQNQIEIEFVGLSSDVGELLHYQLMLEGIDRDWTTPSEDRSVNYAKLGPGKYRFLVRAVGAEGTTSLVPATISFTVLRPVWQRWWFLAAAAMFLAAIIHLAHQYRVRRLLELAQIRTRIATDLHDDIGSSLSRMAILSEVVKQRGGITQRESLERLTDIADTARGLVDTMSDIVWSIDPRRDNVRSVALRVRQFAADVLEPKSVKWDLQTTENLDHVKLSPEQRRHLFLIFKEALTNIARHADSRSVWLKLDAAGEQLRAEIRDDGCGLILYPTPGTSENGRGGHGLENMRARAAQLSGRMEIDSAPGSGTKITLTIPVRHGHGMNMLLRRWWN